MSLLLYHIENAGLYPPDWRRIRKAVLTGCPFCQFCGSSKRLEVHHIIPVHVAPGQGALGPNLIVLCRECHLRFGHLGSFRKFWDPDLSARAGESLRHINEVRGSEK